MTGIPYTTGLHRLAEGAYAYLRPPGTWGFSNCGLVTGGEEAILVDNQFDLPSTRTLIETIGTRLPSITVTTVVNTHANGDHCWGNQLFPEAEIIGSRAAACGMAQEIQPDMLGALSTGPVPDALLGDYMHRHFGCFDFTGITVTPPGRTFDDWLEIAVGGRRAELVEVGPAHTDGDVIVHLPAERVLYAGDILFIGDHPIVWAGPIENWIAACTRIAATGAEHIVPGHGPVTDRAGVLLFRDYLEYVAEQTRSRYDAGMPYWEAAADIPMPERFEAWGMRERLVITVATGYRNLGLVDPPPLPEVLHHVAAMERDLAPSG